MQRISLTLHPADLEFFDKMSKTLDVSKSRLIRQAMREFREKHEGNDDPKADLRFVDKHQAGYNDTGL